MGIDISKYDYLIFADASGDDGYSFKDKSCDGSSFSFVVSCFVTSVSELEYNKSVLLDMKHCLSIKPEHELKSTALKRHRNAAAVYDSMKRLRGFAYSAIVDKRKIATTPPITDQENATIEELAHDNLSGLTHCFPILAIKNLSIEVGSSRILIVYDNMKRREMDSIRTILATSSMDCDIIFRDSKDAAFPLIQIADILSGTIRNFYENSLPLKKHNFLCKSCYSPTLHKRRAVLSAPCRVPKNFRLYKDAIADSRFNTVLLLHCPNLPKAIGMSLYLIPFTLIAYYEFLDCMVFCAIKKES